MSLIRLRLFYSVNSLCCGFYIGELQEAILVYPMAQVDLKLLIEQLDDNMDDLEEALAPLLKTTLADSASKLPLLDRVKLYVLSTYAIESLIFCKM